MSVDNGESLLVDPHPGGVLGPGADHRDEVILPGGIPDDLIVRGPGVPGLPQEGSPVSGGSTAGDTGGAFFQRFLRKSRGREDEESGSRNQEESGDESHGIGLHVLGPEDKPGKRDSTDSQVTWGNRCTARGDAEG